jgi:hypothetical protein
MHGQNGRVCRHAPGPDGWVVARVAADRGRVARLDAARVAERARVRAPVGSLILGLQDGWGGFGRRSGRWG